MRHERSQYEGFADDVAQSATTNNRACPHGIGVADLHPRTVTAYKKHKSVVQLSFHLVEVSSYEWYALLRLITTIVNDAGLRWMWMSDKIIQHFLLWLLVLEIAALGMQIKVNTDVGTHELQRLVYGD